MDKQEAEIVAQIFGGKAVEGKHDADWSVRIDQSGGVYTIIEREGVQQYRATPNGKVACIAIIPFW